MAKQMSFEDIKKFLLKEKKKYDKQESFKARKEAAKNERAANKLAKMKDFALYSDDKFDSVSELGLSESYSEGGINPEWN